MAKKQTTVPATVDPEPQLDIKVVSWIADHLNATHNDLPIKYVEEWSRRVINNQAVYAYAIYGFSQLHPGVALGGELLKEYVIEFQDKLSLRLVQEHCGVNVAGIPMFEIVGKERLAAALRPECNGSGGKILSIVR